MGINAQTSVPKFTSGDVLTAANTNLLTNAPPVFSGTATRDSAFGGAGEKTLAEGQLCYLEDSNIVQYYDGAAWASVGQTPGLTLISTTAWSGVTVTLDNVFSSTYTHYKIICSATASTGGATAIFTQLRVGGVTNTTSNYNSARNGYNFTTGVINADVTTAAPHWFLWRGNGSASVGGGFAGSMDICYPAVATPTWINGTSVDGSYQASAGGFHNVSTAFDGVIFTNDAGGTVTGTVSIFGYAKS